MLKDMKSYSHLKPGQKGTLRLLEKYGESLLCVRYRFDEKRGVRLKTAEIIVEEKPIKSVPFKDNEIVKVSVLFEEIALRDKLRKMRAQWEPALKAWLVPYRLIRGTELEARIIT